MTLVREDAPFMARAIQLAKRGVYTTSPNPNVGAVIVKNGEIVGEGWHQKAGQAHAEINALEQAGEAAKGATCYVTLEPCCHQGKTGPCSDALINAGIERVVVAMQDPNPKVAGKGVAQLEAAGLQVDYGLMGPDAEAINPGFCHLMRTGRPFITIKMAKSIDGRTAMASGESKWITGPEARGDVQRIRARQSAVVTGIETILHDDAKLDVRYPELGYAHDVLDEADVRQPLRVIVDSRLRIPLLARVLTPTDSVMIATTEEAPSIKVEQLRKRGVQVEIFPQEHRRVSLKALVQKLADMQCHSVMVESGATLAGNFVSQGMIDEYILFMAPKLLGSEARGLFQTPGLRKMSQAMRLKITDCRHIGEDLRITLRPE
jgi:diaminohydroxyphosphoribosylaminopyrimidine deaminase/5-amino-6-(5-phosphoribosylamino)uracil reductase